MSDKAIISELTWRSLEMQKAAFPDMPHFIAPDDFPVLFRNSQRKDRLFIHVMSLAIVADNERDFEKFWNMLPKNCTICLSEREGKIQSCLPMKDAKKLWSEERKLGVAKIGGRISADKRKAKSAEGAERIKDRWGMKSELWPTKALLKEADISYNTAKTILGPRPIAQYNYQAAQKRKERRNAKA